MRIEVFISDASPEANILSRVADPEAYVLELVRNDRGARAAKKLNGLPDYLGILAQADSSPHRFTSREEVDSYIAGLRAEW